MTRPTGRQRQWALYLDGKAFPVALNRGVPAWELARLADVEGQTSGVQDVERHYRSGHSGYGWSQYLAPNTYHYAIDGDLRFPGQAICGPRVTTIHQGTKDSAAGVVGFFELGNFLYTLSGRYINRITPSTDTVTQNATFPYSSGGANTLLTEAELFDGSAYIANSTLDYLLRWNGSTFTAQTNAPLGSRLAKWWSETDWVLAISYTAKGTTCLAWVAQNADVNVAANWTGFANNDYSVGDGTGSITGLAAVERTPFIGRTDGLYYLDVSGRSPLVVPAMPVDSNNGVGLYVTGEGRIMYPAKSGLYRYDPQSGVAEDISPGRGLPDRSGIHGLKTAIAQFRAWTYVAVYDGTDSYLMCGRAREGDEAGFGSMIWHGALAKITGTKITSMFISSLTDPPRLWLGLLSGHVAYIRLPSNGDNPLHDTACRFSATTSVYLPADDYGLGKGHLPSVAIEVEGLTSYSSVLVYERRDLGTWTTIGSASANGRTVLDTTGDKRFNRCELRYDINNADTTSTPIVRVLTGKVARRPEKKSVYRTTVLCTDDAISRLGIQTRYTGRQLADYLETMDENAPVTMIDHWTGKERESDVLVSVEAGRIFRQDEEDAGGLAYDLILKEYAEAGLLLAEDGDVLTTEAGEQLALE